MKKLTISMAMFSILMTATLFVISHNLSQELKPYRSLEGDLKEAASIYMLHDSMITDEDEYEGYVMVKKTNDYDYISYIKCADYTTKDYE